MTSAMQISRNRVQELDEMRLFYCNELPWRCSNPRCRDCSTAVADILNASGANVNRCSTSFSLAEWCFHATRPQWFTDLYGDFPGTYISYDAAHHTPCIGLSGSNWGMNADSNGHGHVEYVPGEGPLTWGAHSHSTGVGYDGDGIDTHSLDFFAVPPHFLPWMIPAPPIDWASLHILIEWKTRVSARRQVDKKGKRVSGVLERGDRGPDILIASKLLHNTGYLVSAPGEAYGMRLAHSVLGYKRRNGWTKENQKGNSFGADMANSILR